MIVIRKLDQNELPPPIKRPRGRPRKNPIVPPAVPAKPSMVRSEVIENSSVPLTPKRRGRPPKVRPGIDTGSIQISASVPNSPPVSVPASDGFLFHSLWIRAHYPINKTEEYNGKIYRFALCDFPFLAPATPAPDSRQRCEVCLSRLSGGTKIYL